MSVAEARSILREAPGVMVVDKREDGGYITPVEAAGEFATYVSRIREDATIENGLNYVGCFGQSAKGCRSQHRADRRNDRQSGPDEKSCLKRIGQFTLVQWRRQR